MWRSPIALGGRGSSCPEAIRIIPLLQHDQDRPEDLDTEAEDHAADSVRYACMSRPLIRSVPKPKEPEKPREPSPDLTAARERCLELSGIADDAQRRYELAARAATEARTILDRAEQERGEAHRAARAAHQEAEKARRDLGRLERR